MKKAAWLTGLLGLILTLAITPSQANFVQCPAAGGNCGDAEGTTENADVINGSPLSDIMFAQGGNDILFGGADGDFMIGEEGDDFISGGPGSERGEGREGNDILWAGPDDGESSQSLFGQEGNDQFIVLASEVTTCLLISGGQGQDIVSFLGFGPYVAINPFGQPGFNQGQLLVIDPITGGQIAILVNENDDVGVEVIYGLPSPNVTIIPLGIPDGCPPPTFDG